MPNAPVPYDDDLAYVDAVGCGSGVSTQALVDAGYEVIGLEPSPSPAAMARAAAPSAKVVEVTLHGVGRDPRDATLAIGEPLTYHERVAGPQPRLQAFFASAARALRTGGRLMFGVIETGTSSLTARGWTGAGRS